MVSDSLLSTFNTGVKQRYFFIRTNVRLYISQGKIQAPTGMVATYKTGAMCALDFAKEAAAES